MSKNRICHTQGSQNLCHRKSQTNISLSSLNSALNAGSLSLLLSLPRFPPPHASATALSLTTPHPSPHLSPLFLSSAGDRAGIPLRSPTLYFLFPDASSPTSFSLFLFPLRQDRRPLISSPVYGTLSPHRSTKPQLLFPPFRARHGHLFKYSSPFHPL
jgi:hypothetical protein